MNYLFKKKIRHFREGGNLIKRIIRDTRLRGYDEEK